MKKLYRIENGKLLAGVCGGLGDYFNIDHSIIRILYVLLTLASVGIGLVAYIVAAIIIPSKSQVD